jgi:hypothetical protein
MDFPLNEPNDEEKKTNENNECCELCSIRFICLQAESLIGQIVELNSSFATILPGNVMYHTKKKSP